MSDKKRKTDTEFSELKNTIVEEIQKLDESDHLISVLKTIKQILHAKKSPVHICGGCDNMDFDGSFFIELPTSKWGHEMYFCQDCARYCDQCSQHFCDNMSYQHQDCKQNDDEDEDSAE